MIHTSDEGKFNSRHVKLFVERSEVFGDLSGVFLCRINGISRSDLQVNKSRGSRVASYLNVKVVQASLLFSPSDTSKLIDERGIIQPRGDTPLSGRAVRTVLWQAFH